MTGSKNTDYFRWEGMAKGQTVYDAIVKLAEHNNDTVFEWGDLQLDYGMGWLSGDRRKKKCEVCGK